MAQEIILTESDVGLMGPNGPVHAVKGVEITEDCTGLRKGVRALMFYAPAQGSRIVAFRLIRPGEKYPGAGVNAFRFVERPSPIEFDDWAMQHLGLDEQTLRDLLVRLAPNMA